MTKGHETLDLCLFNLNEKLFLKAQPPGTWEKGLLHCPFSSSQLIPKHTPAQPVFTLTPQSQAQQAEGCRKRPEQSGS